MALTHTQPNTQARRVGLSLSGAVPLLVYLAAISANGYTDPSAALLGSALRPELALQGPHAISSLFASLWCQLPMGPLALRVAVASAVAASLACIALYRALDTGTRVLGVHTELAVLALSLGGAWLLAGCPAFAAHALRPSPYPLQAALSLWTLERLTALQAKWPTRDRRALATAAFAYTLALFNDTGAALLLLPACLPSTVRVLRAGSQATLHAALALATPGLMATLVATSTGAVRPLQTPLQGTVGIGAFASASVEQLHLAAFLAVAGMVWIVLTPGLRRLGTLWTSAALVPVLGWGSLQVLGDANDDLGHLLPVLGALCLLATLCVARLCTREGQETTERPAALVLLAALAFAGLGLAQLHNGSARVDLRAFDRSERFGDWALSALPPRAAVIEDEPDLSRILDDLAGERGARPDLLRLGVGQLGQTRHAADLARAHPTLRNLQRDLLLHGELRAEELQSLAARRPLMLSLSLGIPIQLFETVVPRGPYFEVIPDGVTRTDQRSAAKAQAQRLEQVQGILSRKPRDARLEPLMRSQYEVSALYYLSHGDRRAAAAALDLAQRTAKSTALAQRLRAALGDDLEVTTAVPVRPLLEVGPNPP